MQQVYVSERMQPHALALPYSQIWRLSSHASISLLRRSGSRVSRVKARSSFPHARCSGFPLYSLSPHISRMQILPPTPHPLRSHHPLPCPQHLSLQAALIPLLRRHPSAHQPWAKKSFPRCLVLWEPYIPCAGRAEEGHEPTMILVGVTR